MDLFPLPGALVYSRSRAGTQKITGAGNEARLEQTGNSSRARTASSSMLQVPEKSCKLPANSHPSEMSFAGDTKTGWSGTCTRWLCYHSELLQQAVEMGQCEVQLNPAPGKKSIPQNRLVADQRAGKKLGRKGLGGPEETLNGHEHPWNKEGHQSPRQQQAENFHWVEGRSYPSPPLSVYI